MLGSGSLSLRLLAPPVDTIPANALVLPANAEVQLVNAKILLTGSPSSPLPRTCEDVDARIHLHNPVLFMP